MKDKKAIIDILPDKGVENEIKLKEISPRNIMKEYEEAIKEKYPKYLSAFVTETSKINEEDDFETLSYSFYIIAFIGKGYNYKLFEVIPKLSYNPYPIEIILFEKHPHSVGEVNTPEEFSNTLFYIFKSSFAHNVIYNLIAQVELYNESRSDNVQEVL